MLRVFPIVLAVIVLGCSDDDEGTPTGSGGTPTLSVGDVETIEGGLVNFTVTLSARVDSDVTFSYATADGTASSAQGADYNGASGNATIPARQTSTGIIVSTQDDAAQELPETFTLTLSSPANATISSGSATATIWDNDGVSFSQQVRPIILTSGCLDGGCHGPGSTAGGFSFGSGDYNSVKGPRGTHGNLVFPQQSDRSNLYLKVTASPPFGSRMPLGGPFLPEGNISLIKDWIDQGAQNN